MVRTRSSLPANSGITGKLRVPTTLSCSITLVASQTDSNRSAAEPAPASRNAPTSRAGPVKRGRGRPSKASIAAASATRDSISSVTNSNDSESVSGYSTPLTSNVPTPAPEKSSKFEVVIPSTSSKSHVANATAMKKARDYMMRNDPKNKRGYVEIGDSEEDQLSDPSPNARRTRHDEKVARKLQEELDYQAAALMQDGDQNASEDELNGDGDDYSVASPKGKGKGKAVARPSRSTRNSTNQTGYSAQDSLHDSVDSDYDEPPAKRQKTKGKARMTAPPMSDNDDDDIPRELLPVLFSHVPRFLSLYLLIPTPSVSFHCFTFLMNFLGER